MSNVIPLFTAPESLLDFVRREGVVNTSGVETRFGLSNLQARAALQRLVESGDLEKDERRFPVGWGSVAQWRPK